MNYKFKPVELPEIENKINKAIKNFLPLQAGDVPATWADVDDLVENLGYKPQTTIQYGINRFIEWYKNFYLNK